MKNKFKQQIVEAGRYDEILNIIQTLVKKNHRSYPVNPFINKYHQTLWRVDGRSVFNESKIYVDFISSDECETLPHKDEIENFLLVIHTELEMRLHNYANSISHRTVPTVDMEQVRCLQIIQSSIDCLEFSDYEWTIPVGWKKLELKKDEMINNI